MQSNSQQTDFERESNTEESEKVAETQRVEEGKKKEKEVKTKKDKEESDVIFLDSSRLLSKVDNKKVNSSRDMMTEVDFLSANASKYSPKREQELSI